MKYFLILGLLLCIGCENEKTEVVNDSQKTAFVKTKVKPTKIDSLNTKEEIQAFIQKLDYPFVRFRKHNDSIRIHKPLGKFELKKIKEFNRGHRNDIDSLTKIIADSLKITESFYKADIDNNGFSDLVIIGDDNGCSGFSLELNSTRSCDYSVYALMNFGNDSINPVSLMRRDFVGDAVIPKIEDVNGKIALLIFEPPKFSWRDKKKISDLKKTKLAYKNGTFVEYNENPRKYLIEKIEYETEPCYGSCPIFELTINNDRTASLNAIEFNSLEPNLWEYEISQELKGQFETTIDKKSYQDLIDLLNYLDFPSLEENYWVSATDNPGSKLTITYDQGKTKIISDYGKMGTLGLIKIYDMIANLRSSQKWK